MSREIVWPADVPGPPAAKLECEPCDFAAYCYEGSPDPEPPCAGAGYLSPVYRCQMLCALQLTIVRKVAPDSNI